MHCVVLKTAPRQQCEGRGFSSAAASVVLRTVTVLVCHHGGQLQIPMCTGILDITVLKVNDVASVKHLPLDSLRVLRDRPLTH
mmetsp:Transcript_76458/g.219034  ORF Transcript_76458/g.219034 Transcript_76458/m.219034 type:complete len:83 (+) Transcript_76458:318-566(+)